MCIPFPTFEIQNVSATKKEKIEIFDFLLFRLFVALIEAYEKVWNNSVRNGAKKAQNQGTCWFREYAQMLKTQIMLQCV